MGLVINRRNIDRLPLLNAFFRRWYTPTGLNNFLSEEILAGQSTSTEGD